MTGARERPILFSASMVRAILDGDKTQTRRVIKPRRRDEVPYIAVDKMVYSINEGEVGESEPCGDPRPLACPYGTAGDLLWVRETFGKFWGGWKYRATDDRSGLAASNWKPSIHMPRAASRITLEIVKVRAERLQDITEKDARAEGVPVGKLVPTRIVVTDIAGKTTSSIGKAIDFTARGAFCHLWDGINGKRAPWTANPLVWVVEFKRVRP